MNRLWDGYFERGLPGRSRQALLTRGFCLLLVMDIAANMLTRGGRYGADGFHVAHFVWLDWVQPAPSQALYVGCLLVAAGAAGVAALWRPSRATLLVAALAQGWSWSMSQLDSYQHHYLLTLVLIALWAMAPQTQAPPQAQEPARDSTHEPADAPDANDEPRGRWGGPLLCVNVAIIYGFTAVNKLDPAWRQGLALRRIASARSAQLVEWGQRLGVEAEALWPLLAKLTIAAQLVVAAAYLVTPLRAKLPRLSKALMTLGLVTALGFHAGVEWIGMQIEWFSAYMIGMAVCVLGPERPLDALHGALERAARAQGAALARLSALGVAMVVTLSAATLGVAASRLDLPGALGVATAAGVALIVALLRRIHSPERWAALTSLALSLALSGLLIWGVVARHDVRYDYYRYQGGDAYRRAQASASTTLKRELLMTSIRAYERANLHAPPGKDRAPQLERSKQALERLGPPPTTANAQAP